jgi:hypothetical protein
MYHSLKNNMSYTHQPGPGSTVCPQGLPNLVQMLRRRVQELGEKTVYTYLNIVNWNGGRSLLQHISNRNSSREKESCYSILRASIFPRHSSGACVRAWLPCRSTSPVPTDSWQALEQQYLTQDRQPLSPCLPSWKSTDAK